MYMYFFQYVKTQMEEKISLDNIFFPTWFALACVLMATLAYIGEIILGTNYGT